MFHKIINIVGRLFRRNRLKVTPVVLPAPKVPESVVLPASAPKAKLVAKVIATRKPKFVPHLRPARRVVEIFGCRKNRARVTTAAGETRVYKVIQRSGNLLALRRKGHKNGKPFLWQLLGSAAVSAAA